MKKISLFCLCVMILVAGCFVIAPPKSQAEPITLTYSNFFPPPTFNPNWPMPGVRK